MSLGILTTTCAVAQEPGNGWWIEGADDGGSIAMLGLPDNKSIGQISIVCSETGGLGLRVDMIDNSSPSAVTITDQNKQSATIEFDEHGQTGGVGVDVFSAFYERATGMNNGADPKEARITFQSNTEDKGHTYNAKGFNRAAQWMRTTCEQGNVAEPEPEVAVQQPPKSPRTRVGAMYEDYCVRYARSEDKEQVCACLVDNITAIANRDNPGIQSYADVVLIAIRSYRESRITGTMPEYAVRMALIGHPGNPAAQPAVLLTRSIDINDEAVANCQK